MALESNAWLTSNPTTVRDQQNKDQLNSQQQQQQQQFVSDNPQQRGLLKIPSSIGKCSMFTQTENTKRFAQTEAAQRYAAANNCHDPTSNNVHESSNNNHNNKQAEQSSSTMFDPSSMQQQQQQGGNPQQQNNSNAQQNMYPNSEVKVQQQKDGENKNNTTVAEFPFCYNVNMLQKVHQTQNTIPVTGITDDKGCYRFDVPQTFGYNYALVNQMSLAAAASSATFKCDVCGLTFGHLSLLNHHKRIHTTNVTNAGTQSNVERQFTCDICGACFNLAGELKSHKTGMHGKAASAPSKCCDSCGVEINCEHQQSANGNVPVGTKKKGGKFVKCENCEETPAGSVANTISFVVAGAESQARESTKPGHHPVKRRGVASVTKCHKCNGSGIIFIGGTKNSSGVEKPFHCNVCDGTFSRYSSLWSHKRLHSGEKNFKCDICGLAFAKAAYLKNHNRVHTGEKPFKCTVCGMQFSQSPHLKNHERIHSGERPYQCEVCDKTFARHSTLWNHRRIHTGEKPYRCDVCGSAFNQATHLKNHAKVHTGEKPFRCDICDVGFSDRFALKRHRSIHEKYGRVAAQPAIPPSSQAQTNPPDNMGQQLQYKCEVGGPIAFPGCSRPLEEKQ